MHTPCSYSVGLYSAIIRVDELEAEVCGPYTVYEERIVVETEVKRGWEKFMCILLNDGHDGETTSSAVSCLYGDLWHPVFQLKVLSSSVM